MALEARFGSGQAPPDRAPRTSLRLENGLPRHGKAHGDRLRAGLLALHASCDWLEEGLAQAWAWAERESQRAPLLALRLQADPKGHTLHARLEDLPPIIQPYTLLPLPHPLHQPDELSLAPHKGCLGPWNLASLATAQQAGAQDALLHREDLTVVETAIASVGCLDGRRLLLPPSGGRVRSIAELWDLPGWADERGWEVVSVPFSVQDARQGQLWCFNALRGLWPAACLLR